MIMKSKMILVVEDDSSDVKLLMASITDDEFKNNIKFAHNGQEAVDFLKRDNNYSTRTSRNPDLILLDLNIPLINGIEVLEIIKSDISLKTIPVVVFSSSNYDLDIKKCYDLGINSYVVKPMDFVNYKKTVQQLFKFWVDINQPPCY